MEWLVKVGRYSIGGIISLDKPKDPHAVNAQESGGFQLAYIRPEPIIEPWTVSHVSYLPIDRLTC